MIGLLYAMGLISYISKVSGRVRLHLAGQAYQDILLKILFHIWFALESLMFK